MYEAGKEIYTEYGATILAWGGKPRPASIEANQGLKVFSSVGMVTEFSRFLDHFPDTYEQALCRDLGGAPFKVPWLTDHQHKGVPYWWCCTRQPLFRQYLSERVVDTVKAGANGVHIDDHLGTAGALYSGGCYCERCVNEFRDYIKNLSASELSRLGIDQAGAYDQAVALRKWLADKPGRKPADHPLWRHWRIYQLRGAAAFMGELRGLAARTAGRPVPMSANACVMWGPHLNDYQVLDFLSAEVEHHAAEKGLSDEPLAGYRIAEAVNRPLAATASGGDWAFISERKLHGMVRSWIALGYAAGQSLMAPNRQWCYTPQKGTHWYAGPKERFAPLYRFVRQQPFLFDGYQTYADVILAYSQRTFDRDPRLFKDACNRLAAANLSYRLALGGDEVVERALLPEELRGAPRVLVLAPADFQEADRRLLDSLEATRKCDSLETLLSQAAPAARVSADGALRVLPRAKPGSAVIHLVNWNYSLERDAVDRLEGVRLSLDLRALQVEGAREARLYAPGAEPVTVAIRDNTIVIPASELWTVVEVKSLGK